MDLKNHEFYMGHKRVNAMPMTRQEYNDFRGWELPADEDGGDAGFLVEYIDGGEANTEQFAGYVSWSPKAVFEEAYRQNGSLTFGDAVELCKHGNKIARTGWNGANQFVFYIEPVTLKRVVKDLSALPQDVEACGAFAMKTTRNQLQVGWLASQGDMSATDWVIVG